MTDLVPEELSRARAQFAVLVEDLRPELHRYCSRMVGSAMDGEDIVQDALAKAYYALSMMEEVPNLRPWIFRIAHNKAIDHLRRYEQRHAEPLDEAVLIAPAESPLADREIAALAMSLYVKLTPLQRSCVVMKDVLEHSLAEISEVLDLTVPAIKSALHRGRRRLRELAQGGVPERPPENRAELQTLKRYVDRFNARDWDALREMLAADARLELVNRVRRQGAAEVGSYFSNYDRVDDWLLNLELVEGQPMIVVRDREPSRPLYLIRLGCNAEGEVAEIRDFRYARYVMQSTVVALSPPSQPLKDIAP